MARCPLGDVQCKLVMNKQWPIQGFQQTVRGAFEMGDRKVYPRPEGFHEGDGQCSKPSHGFLYRSGPGILVKVEFQNGMEVMTPEYCKSIQDKPHCLNKGDINIVGMALCVQAGAL